MFLKNNYVVDFRKDKSVNSLLGFGSNLYTSGFHESENMVNILTANSILVNIDIFQVVMLMVPHNPQFTRSFQMSLLGIKLLNPHNLLYLPITSDTIHSITIFLTDQNRNELNLRGENLSMRFHLREI